MRKLHLGLLCAGLFAGVSTAQTASDILYYKFDSGGGKKAINYSAGAGSTGIPTEGTVNAAPAAFNPWVTPGLVGTASQRGTANTLSTEYNFVDTGWKGPLMGDFTVAFCAKQRVAPGTGLSYLFGGNVSFRCFTNGVAGRELWVRSWGGPDIKLPNVGATFQARAMAAKGVHVALTVDGTKKVAQWYIDGATHGAPFVIPNGANVAAGAGFKIGKHTSNTSSSAYDLDEFRFTNSLATPAMIKIWATKAVLAAEGQYGAGCGGASLDGTGGLPALGNLRFGAEITAGAGTVYALGVGTNRLKAAFGPLPFDLGAVHPQLKGCMWESSAVLFLGGAVGASGKATLPIPIANVTAYAGTTLYSQAVTLLSGNLGTTNAHASAIGN